MSASTLHAEVRLNRLHACNSKHPVVCPVGQTWPSGREKKKIYKPFNVS